MFSYFSGTLPTIFEDYFTPKKEHLHNDNTRSASNIHIDYQRTNYGKFSVKHRPRGGGVLPYITYTGMCRPTGS